jgi:hypothetical protein
MLLLLLLLLLGAVSSLGACPSVKKMLLSTGNSQNLGAGPLLVRRWLLLHNICTWPGATLPDCPGSAEAGMTIPNSCWQHMQGML